MSFCTQKRSKNSQTDIQMYCDDWVQTVRLLWVYTPSSPVNSPFSHLFLSLVFKATGGP